MMAANHLWEHQLGKEDVPWSGLSEDLSSASRVPARKPKANIRVLEPAPTYWGIQAYLLPGQ